MANATGDVFIPAIHRTQLTNGMRVLGMEYDRVPWVSITFMLKRGAEADPPGLAGAADLLAEYLTLGTAQRDQLQLALDIESRGASLQAHARWDLTSISLEGLAEDFDALLATLAEVVLTPGFPAEDWDFLKDRRQAELVHLQDDPREMANRHYSRIFFGASPYGHPINGDLETVAALTLDDIRGFFQTQFHPAASSLVVVGMVDADRVQEAAARLFGGWQTGQTESPVHLVPPEQPGKPGIYLVDRPDLTQSEIRAGHLGLPRHHPDYFPLLLANYVLGGGGFSSRLMARIRSDLGLTYGVNSQFHFRRAPGPFLVSTFTPAPSTAQVVEEIRLVMQEVKNQGITAAELADAQSYYTGHFPLGLETPSGLARHLITLDLHDLELDYLQTYRQRLNAATLEQVRAAAHAHLHPEDLVILVLGPAAACATDLARCGPVTPVPA